MLRVITRRLIHSAPLLFIVPFVIFVFLSFIGGDVALTLAGDTPTPEHVAQIRRQLHLNDPLLTQYGKWVADAVHGDFGESLITKEPVADMLSNRLEATLSLVVLATLIGVATGTALAILAARKPGGLADRSVTVGTSVIVSAPPFWIGLILVVVFAISNRWLPATGYSPLSDGLDLWLKSLILPCVALSAVMIAEVARQLRGSIVDTMSKDYVLTARAKGLPNRVIVGKHVLKNAAVPVTTLVGFRMAQLIGGTVVVERVFNIHGIGSMAADAVLTQDISVILGVVFVTVVAVVLINLLTDIVCAYLNPKIRVR